MHAIKIVLIIIGFLLIPKFSIYGQLSRHGKLVYENENTEPYEIRGLSIRIPISVSNINYCDSIKISKDDHFLNPKDFLGIDDEYYELYDGLESGLYKITFVSDFRDIYSYELNLKTDTITEYLFHEFGYTTKELQKSDFEEIIKSDSIQISIFRLGCYSFSKELIQINKLIQNKEKYPINSKNGIYLKTYKYKKRLLSFMEELIKEDDCYTDHSCAAIYSIKLENKIYSSGGCCGREETILK